MTTRPEELSNDEIAHACELAAGEFLFDAETHGRLTEAARRLRAMAWQPIDASPVPQDGSWVAMTCADDGEDADFEVGRWLSLYKVERFEEVGDGLYRKVADEVFGWTGINNAHRATHWMSITPPTAGRGGG